MAEQSQPQQPPVKQATVIAPQHHVHPRSHSGAEAAAGIVPSHGISINLPDSSGGLHPSSSRPHPVRHMSDPPPMYQSPIRHHKRAPSKSAEVKTTLNARSHYGSSDDDGGAVHRINQYIIKQEIGRGSFGAVHLAADQFGNEYAVKEFSKSRLRKRAQSNLLRKPNQQARRSGHLAAGLGFNSPLHRHTSSDRIGAAENNSLELIKEEIAIMKKLNHNNLVALIEVLDDPDEDSLYMVLEMCKKGVVMKVGLEERAEPYTAEACRCWFRDMILGIEYLHAQGIIHRDIKPDNCLITADDVLKIVDFGVSEMFEKESEMHVSKSAGSPAFMPPELCVAKHGHVSGRAADIWSMGVTLHCLRYGHIPFEKPGMLELYQSIREDPLPLQEEPDPNFQDLMARIFDKNPQTRITMKELRNQPWVTKNGTDPLLSAEENCSDIIAPPTQSEIDHAVTGNMGHLMVVMKAVKKFKKLLLRRRQGFTDSVFGRDSNRLVAPPQSIRKHDKDDNEKPEGYDISTHGERTQLGGGVATTKGGDGGQRAARENREEADGRLQAGGQGRDPRQARSADNHDRKPMDRILVTAGVHRPIDIDDNFHKLPLEMDRMSVRQPAEVNIGVRAMRLPGETDGRFKQRMETNAHRAPSWLNPGAYYSTHNSPSSSVLNTQDKAQTLPFISDHAKGHAHDPLEDTLFLSIGSSSAEPLPGELSSDQQQDPLFPIVSESPPAVDINIYEEAYQDEMKRILERRGRRDQSIYLTRRVEHREDLKTHENIIASPHDHARNGVAKLMGMAGRGPGPGAGLAGVLMQAKEKAREERERERESESGEGREEGTREEGEEVRDSTADLERDTSAVRQA
ncbi:Pkinase-domain-containing protein [Hortaea werneckii]|nr:Pkinase-domain-containing protein [Hortaea werneckii]KAI7106989.1 Pkinase-domain-containing protein [Hortaea werneckii]KAI7289724.1 Pkinase-domain-containing protein [Hortaea werneckii]KAI7400598.1 Pkinase-domain-containing protein [Hortaea werneckii]